jgi:hypothetical protein
MFTSAQCLAIAGQKLVQAELDGRHRRRLITAAQAWCFLASKLGGEAPAISTERTTKKHAQRKQTRPAAK